MLLCMDTRKAGARGGKATAKNRTAKERSEAARKAVRARWARTAKERKRVKAEAAEEKRVHERMIQHQDDLIMAELRKKRGLRP